MSSSTSSSRICLPRHVIPSHYDVIIKSDMENFTFEGEVTIALKVQSPSTSITLNAVELDILSSTLNGTLQSDPWNFDTEKQTVTFSFPGMLFQEGQSLTLNIKYKGIINELMAGFYRSSYTVDGVKKYMAVTQFEAVDCRRAVPCFDEPDLKATFDVTLLMDPKYTGLCNEECIINELQDQHRIMKFATTPIMSTYLLAFAIGEFEFIEAFTTPTTYLPHRVRCRVYTTHGLKEQGQFALDVAVKTLTYFSEIFGIPYPLTKCDQIAVPDFSAGAMENWGLITYRTVALLIDQEMGAVQSKKWIATTVTHELAHQWFGNLVTFKHWDELWLNEGFATWVGTYGASFLFPEWDLWTLFLSEDQNRALSVDGVRSSHPIQVEVLNPKEINQIFDGISYSKGASVIHMLTQWLGVDVFFKGIRTYLKKFQYSNASTDDLWHCLGDASTLDVKSFMGLWTLKVGYPMVYVNEEEKGSELCLQLKQRRFLQTGDVKEEEDATIWRLPLNLASDDSFSTVSHEIMKDREHSLVLKGVSDYLLNQHRSGFYRVAYPASRLERLSQSILNKKIGVQDRMGLFDDAFALAHGGYISVVGFLSMVAKSMSFETEYVIFREIAFSLSSLCHVWANQPVNTVLALNLFRQNIFSKHAKLIGFDVHPSEPALKKMLRPLLISQAGMTGCSDIIAEAQKRFQSFLTDPKSLASDLFRSTFCIVVKYGAKDSLETVMQLYQSTSNIDVRYAALSSMGYVQDPSLIQTVLTYSISEHVRPQDIHYVWGSLADNPIAWKPLWHFLQHHWVFLSSRYEGNFNMLGTCVSYATKRMTTQEEMQEIHQFFKDKDTRSFIRKLNESLDEIQSNISWLKRDAEAVSKWLSQHR
ncbi:Aminopeptidase 2 mitochondrial [Coelomomyces lativittatus]|nr:Aminopeptidase 2 mitochondrial [Coelomomyces lativittatus]KAJ1511384.1 Aminopeptidase 2 mitochondrial [Coelomomyces lativittatus]KAJ1516923.1 Aminopeptidase 2 mitochondrial [Coelomomyces lativittatus]